MHYSIEACEDLFEEKGENFAHGFLALVAHHDDGQKVILEEIHICPTFYHEDCDDPGPTLAKVVRRDPSKKCVTDHLNPQILAYDKADDILSTWNVMKDAAKFLESMMVPFDDSGLKRSFNCRAGIMFIIYAAGLQNRFKVRYDLPEALSGTQTEYFPVAA